MFGLFLFVLFSFVPILAIVFKTCHRFHFNSVGRWQSKSWRSSDLIASAGSSWIRLEISSRSVVRGWILRPEREFSAGLVTYDTLQALDYLCIR